MPAGNSSSSSGDATEILSVSFDDDYSTPSLAHQVIVYNETEAAWRCQYLTRLQSNADDVETYFSVLSSAVSMKWNGTTVLYIEDDYTALRGPSAKNSIKFYESDDDYSIKIFGYNSDGDSLSRFESDIDGTYLKSESQTYQIKVSEDGGVQKSSDSGESFGALAIGAYGVFVDTNTSSNALSTSYETFDIDSSFNTSGCSWDYTNNYLNVSADISLLEIEVEYTTYYESAGLTASHCKLGTKLFYSDDDGDTWETDYSLGKLLNIPYNTFYQTHSCKIQCPHVSGRIYQLRRACSTTSLDLYKYDADVQDVTAPDGTDANTPTYPIKLNVKGW